MNYRCGEGNFPSCHFHQLNVERHSAAHKQVLFNNYNLCVGRIFPQEAGEKRIIHVNEKHSMLADETSRTRFKTRFRVSGNERCKRCNALSPLSFFSLPSSFFCFQALQSDHLRSTRNQLFSLSLSLSLSLSPSL